MKKLLLPILVCLSAVSHSALAYNAQGVADEICKAKGATPMLSYRTQDLDINGYSNDKGQLEYSLTLRQPNPINDKLILSNTVNDIYTNLIMQAIDQNRTISLCFSAKGDIVSMKTEASAE
ncbi:TPA: hypothetical protein ACX6S1_003150 [Photobacterium damselae]